jgi:DHA1 family tetracycline resistance protein-like MFS transporter
MVLMPYLGATILGEVSHLAPSDLRVGATFFVCAVLQTIALVFAFHFFQTHSSAHARTE